MHERSLMDVLLKQVHKIQAEYQPAVVKEIAVEAGPLSGVEPELLLIAFADHSNSFPGATLMINKVPVKAICQDCQETIIMERFLSRCPHCQSLKLQITGGDTFRLLHVTLQPCKSG